MKRGGAVTLRVTVIPGTLARSRTPGGEPGGPGSLDEPAAPIVPIVSRYLDEPGPYDTLDPAKVREEVKFVGMPKEVVGVLGDLRGVLPTSQTIQGPAISPDGKWIIGHFRHRTRRIASDDFAYLWDTKTLTPHYLGYAPTLISHPLFTPDGAYALVPRVVSIWLVDLRGESPKIVNEFRRGNQNGIRSMALSGDGKTLAIGGGSGELSLWDVREDAKDPREIVHQSDKTKSSFGAEDIRGVSISGNGKRLAACFVPNYMLGEADRPKARLNVWEISQEPAQLLHEIELAPGTAYPPHLSEDGQLLLQAGYDQGTPEDRQRLILWDISGPAPVEKPTARARPAIPNTNNFKVYGALYHNTGHEFVINISDSRYEVWSYQDGLKKVRDLPAGVRSRTPDGERMVRAGANGIEVLDRDGKVLVAGADARLHVNRQPFLIGGKVYTLQGDNSTVNNSLYQLDRIADGRFVSEGVVAGLNTPQASATDTRLSPDGKYLAARRGQRIQVWPVIDGRILNRDDERTVGESNLNATADYSQPDTLHAWVWQPDGQAILTAMHSSGEIHRWDMTKRPPTRTLVGRHPEVTFLSWSEDARTLVSTGVKDIRLWDMTLARPRSRTAITTADFLNWTTTSYLEPSGNGLWFTGVAKEGKRPTYRLALNRKDVAPEMVFADHGSVMFPSPNGRIVASFHQDRGWTFWNWHTRETIATWEHGPYEANCGRWTDDGRHFCLTHYGAMYVLRLEAAPKPSEPIVPIVSRYLDEPGPYDTLDPAKIREEVKFEGMPKEVVGVLGERRGVMHEGGGSTGISPDGKWVLQATNNSKTATIWNTRTLVPFCVTSAGGHGTYVAFSSDSKFGLCHAYHYRNEPSGYKLYDLSNDMPRLVRVIPGGGSPGVFSPDNHFLFIGPAIWDLTRKDDKPIVTLEPSDGHWRGMAISGNGKRLAAWIWEGDVKAEYRIWDVSVTPARLLHTLPATVVHTQASPLLLSHDGNTLIEGAYYNHTPKEWQRIAVWDLSGEKPKLLHKDDTNSPYRFPIGWFEHDQSIVIQGNHHYSVWSYKDGLKKIRDLPAGVVAVTPDGGKRMVRVDNGRIDMLDQEGNVVVAGNDMQMNLTRQPFQFGEKVYTVSGASTGAANTNYHLNRIADGGFVNDGVVSGLKFFVGHYRGANNPQPSPDSKFIAYSDYQRTYIFPVVDNRLQSRIEEMTAGADNPNAPVVYNSQYSILSWLWQPDGKAIWTAMANGEIHKWDMTQRPPTMKKVGTHEKVQHLAWSADAQTLASVGGKEVKLWDMRGKTPVARSIPRPGGAFSEVTTCFLEPGGTGLWISGGPASGQAVHRIALDRPDVAPELVFPEMGSQMKLSPCGKIVASIHPVAGWTFWELGSRKIIAKWEEGPFSFDSGRWTEDGRHFCIVQYGAMYVLRLEQPPTKP